MWIPKAVYDRAPQYWMLVGLLLIVLGIYLGLEMHPLFFIAGFLVGVASLLWGFRVYDKRRHERLFETKSFDVSLLNRK
jgi:hypothetical protein